MKILTFDIETAPNTSYTWGKWEQNVIAFKQEGYMLSFSYKWLHEKTAHVVALCDFPQYKKDPTNDRYLVARLWQLLNEADVVIAYNGKKFDIPKANARFAIHRLPRPKPYKVVDPLQHVRRMFKFESNKLDDVGEYLGCGKKIDTGGFKLWLGCMNGDMASWRKMKQYNKQDVVLLERVYLILREWMDNHPSLYFDAKCGVCGSTKIQWRGLYRTSQSSDARRFQCQDCGSWGIRREKHTNN